MCSSSAFRCCEANQRACAAFYCHFTDLNGCQSECAKFGVAYQAVENVKEFSVNTIQPECEYKCKTVTRHAADSDRMCNSLCSIHFSFPNREEYEQEIAQFVV
ncbi:hypothetical protein PRIPAC_92345 [Pristionchus pacificus]|uniref:Uncharacterized protein n=1 Tax=Pristionchus pacificus TaxID=54126 RepID=A0A2A6CHV2_PRIPA|nr:hypothetical protein PRIPAC_92345 [Pristionchus pacificus]|eukprot:PDM77676.1 hypothetical protein PRIPAC_34543 [Pristionchus pacificus]